MKANESTVLIGRKVVLVPYNEGHVTVSMTVMLLLIAELALQKYHSWMENDELRSLTASERLTLEEEFDMQRKRNMSDRVPVSHPSFRKMAGRRRQADLYNSG